MAVLIPLCVLAASVRARGRNSSITAYLSNSTAVQSTHLGLGACLYPCHLPSKGGHAQGMKEAGRVKGPFVPAAAQ